jgi:hypothetical protein
MENIIIKIIADDSGLDGVNKKLADTKKSSEGLTNEMKKTTSEFSNTKKAAADFSKSQSSSLSGSRKSIEDLKSALDSVATDNPFQQLVMFAQQMGEGIADTIQRVGIDMDLLSDKTANVDSELEAFSIVVDTMKEKLGEMDRAGDQSSDMYQELAAAIDFASSALSEMSAKSDEETANFEQNGQKKQKSFRTTRRELEEQIKTMEMLGDTGSVEYQRLVDEAGRLNDIQGDVSRSIKNTASDTRAFDTILEGTQAIAGGFSVAQGAMALFGTENEDVQKMMVKLQAAIAITTGLQQIQNIVQKESTVLMAVSTLQTKAKTAAELLSAKGTIAATVAQRALNIVAKANPYVLLTLALVTVVGALVLFTLGTDKAAKAQQRMNEIEKNNIDLLNQRSAELKQASETNVKTLERELALLQARGASERELADKRAEMYQTQLNHAASQKALYKEEIENLEENKQKVHDLELSINNLNNAKAAGRGRTLIINSEGKMQSVKVTDEAIDNLQKQLDNTKLKVDVAVSTEEAYKDAQNKIDEDQLANQKKAQERARTSAVAEAEARVLAARKGSEQELALKIASLETAYKADMQNADLTTGERLKRAKEMEIAIRRLQEDFRNTKLQDEKTGIEAYLVDVEKGGLSEYNLKIALLNKQRQIDLSNSELTANQRLLIEKKYLENLENITTEFTKSQDEKTIGNEIAQINKKISSVRAGSDEEYALNVQLATKKAELEKKEIEATIKDEELKALRILEINTDLQNQINALSNTKKGSDIDFDRDMALLRIEAKRQEVEQSNELDIFGFNRSAELRKLEIDGINIEKEAIEDKYKAGLIEAKDYQKQMQELILQGNKVQIDAEKEKEAAIKEIRQAAFDFAKSMVDSSFQAEKDNLNQQLSDLQHYYTTDVEEAKKNKDLKLISEEEYSRRELEIKRKLAQAEKNQALFDATVNAAVGITKALSSAPPPFNVILAAITAAAMAVQIKAITSKPLPSYWKGRKSGSGEFALVGEYGPELMWVPHMAAIMPSHDTQKALAGKRDVFDRWDMPLPDKYISPKIEYNYPVMPSIPQKVINQYRQEKEQNLKIDYDLLAKKIGENVGKNVRIPKQKNVTVNVDRSGVSIEDGNTTTRNLNSKFKTKL